MRLTRRGNAALGLVALAIVLAFASGERSLNAVAAPLLGALTVGTLQLWFGDVPSVEPGELPAGYPGERREWSIEVRGRGVAHLVFEWPDGLDGEDIDAVVSPPATLSATVTLAGRGVYELEPTVRRRDALGLVESVVEPASTTTAVVYPRMFRVGRSDALDPVVADEHEIERQEFDALREYQPGDPLRRIHWKSSAKHDEFLVTEFASDRQARTVTIAADAAAGCADAMAAAVGTVAMLALRSGLEVGVVLPDERLPPASGEAHRSNLLAVLARVGDGNVPAAAHEDADVSVIAGRQRTTIEVGTATVAFEDLRSGAGARPIREVAPA